MEWEIRFDVNKYKGMHFGYNNPSYEYLMNDEVVDTEEERVLDITVHRPYNHNAHCVKRANQMLGMIRNNYNNLYSLNNHT